MIRIIAGSFKSRHLNTGKDRTIRPTQDRVKETMFSILGDIEGQRVVDLFAGTGNLGFEAISRGAAHCTFIENNRQSIEIIRSNAAVLSVQDQIDIFNIDAIRFLQNPEHAGIYFADPPYRFPKLDELFDSFLRLAEGTTIVLEAEKELVIPPSIQTKLTSRRIIGETSLNFIRV